MFGRWCQARAKKLAALQAELSKRKLLVQWARSELERASIERKMKLNHEGSGGSCTGGGGGLDLLAGTVPGPRENGPAEPWPTPGIEAFACARTFSWQSGLAFSIFTGFVGTESVINHA